MGLGLVTHHGMKEPCTLACEGGGKQKEQVVQLLISPPARPNISLVNQPKQGVPLELVPPQVLLHASTDPPLPENKGPLTADTSCPPGRATSMKWQL